MPNLTDELSTAKERRLNLQRDSETFLRLFYYKLYFLVTIIMFEFVKCTNVFLA